MLSPFSDLSPAYLAAVPMAAAWYFGRESAYVRRIVAEGLELVSDDTATDYAASTRRFLADNGYAITDGV